MDSITKMDSNALLCFCVSNIVLQEWYLFSRIFLGRKKNHFHKIIRILAAFVLVSHPCRISVSNPSFGGFGGLQYTSVYNLSLAGSVGSNTLVYAIHILAQ